MNQPAAGAPDAFLVGIDVGGSAVKCGIVTADGKVVAQDSIAAGEDTRACDLFCSVAQRVLQLAPGPIRRVGVGLPGLLDRAGGRVLDSPNLPWLTGADVRGAFSDALGIDPAEVLIENDANVAALGEAWIGAADGGRDALIVTLGTGIGGGLLIGGRLHLGAGLAGEIGHVKIEPNGRPCGCGARGCLETLASARAASRRAVEAGLPAEDPGNLSRLCEEARRTPGPERELLRAIGTDLGHGLSAAVALLDLRLFVFAGGFSAALDQLEPGIRAGLSEWVWGDRVGEIRLVPSTLGASSGWIGAARLTNPTPIAP